MMYGTIFLSFYYQDMSKTTLNLTNSVICFYLQAWTLLPLTKHEYWCHGYHQIPLFHGSPTQVSSLIYFDTF